MKTFSGIVAGIILMLFCSEFSFGESQDYYNTIGFSILRSDASQLIIKFKPVTDADETIVTEDGSFTILPNIKGSSLEKSLPGSPSVVTVSALITVPDEKGFSLSSYQISDETIKSYPIAPYPQMNYHKDVSREIYHINRADYQNFVKPEVVTLKYAGISRDRHVALLTIIAAYYDSRLNSTHIPKEIEITINFKSTSQSGRLPVDNNLPTTLNHFETMDWRIIGEPAKIKKPVDKQLTLSSGNWVKIGVSKEAIYKIDASELSSLGYTIQKDLLGTIKIFGNGGKELSELPSDSPKNLMSEQPIIVKTNGNGDLESIIFYGAAANGFNYKNDDFYSWYNHYSDKNYYMLTWGGDPGLRATPVVNSDNTVTNRPTSYTERIFYKEELNCALIGGSGRIWFGGSIFPRSFSNNLSYLDKTGTVRYRFYFAHRTDGTGTFTVSESGKNILTRILPKTSDTQYLDAYGDVSSVDIPANDIPADNRSLLNINYSNPKIAGSTPFFNFYEIHYPRSFVPTDNQIGFWTNQSWTGVNEFSINNFTGEVIGFEVTNPAKPAMILNKSVTGGMFLFDDSLSTSSPKRYFISSNFQKAEINPASFSNLRDIKDESDVIIITHKTLLESAKKYQEYRSNHKSIIVTTEDIFNEFNSGLPDPTAIRDFLAFRLANSPIKPKYVVFWGDGHYDYKNIQTKTANYVLTYQSLEPLDNFKATESYTSDDYFAWLKGNDKYNDIIIGRLPISSNAEGDWMVEKSKYYENNSSLDNWRTYLTLVADDSPTSSGNGDGKTHTYQSEQLANTIIPDYMVNRKIYLPEYPTENIPNGRRKPRVTEDIVSYSNNAGTLTLNWVGHGNPRVWAHEEIFDRDKTISQLKNLNKLFLNTAATCDFARFDMPELRSGAELLLLSRNGGSIGEFSSTRVVYSYDNARINEAFHTELFDRKPMTREYPDIGEVMFAVKQYRANSNDIKYNYFGDPLVKILIPFNIIRIDSINGYPIRRSTDTVAIKGMSKVTISASVINPVDSTIVTDFNGISNLTMLDADYTVNVEDIDGTIHNILKYGGALNRGSFPVVNGRINASFYIPEDISFSSAPGRIFFYANTDDRRTACGYTRQIKYSGVDSIALNTGKPDIKIYLDSLSFLPGDIVSDSPLLIVRVKDDYGVNTSGSGIGHRLEAWIDDSPESIDLTYRTSIATDDIKAVEAKQVLSELSPGTHKVKVRAWNVFNKYSVAETTFRILSGNEGAMIWNAVTYPNPFVDAVNIRFRHNLNQPFSARLLVYDLLGNRVKEVNTTVTSIHTSEILWDGRDGAGSMVPQGQYVLQLNIFTNKGDATTSAGAVLIK